MALTVEFFYDFASPYSYLASTQIEGIVSAHDAVLAWRPFLLGGIFKTLQTRAPASTSPQKAAWMLRDLPRWAKHLGVPFEMNPSFPQNTLLPMRLAVAAQERGHQVPLLRLLFRAMWVDKKVINDPSFLADLLTKIEAPRKLLERCNSGHVKAQLRANTEEAMERGAFGAPSIFVGDELFFGNDRLQFLEHRLARGDA